MVADPSVVLPNGPGLGPNVSIRKKPSCTSPWVTWSQPNTLHRWKSRTHVKKINSKCFHDRKTSFITICQSLSRHGNTGQTEKTAFYGLETHNFIILAKKLMSTSSVQGLIVLMLWPILDCVQYHLSHAAVSRQEVLQELWPLLQLLILEALDDCPLQKVKHLLKPGKGENK